jgi:uncharacterized membrane protein YcaP (DUF421 family)
MDSVLRAAAVYGFMLLLFRVIGRRTLGELSGFDLVLLLIVSESLQNAMVGLGGSVTDALIVVVTMLGINIGLVLLKRSLPALESFLEGLPLVILEDGRLLRERMYRARLDESEILQAAREHGLERLEQIKYAVLERNGKISIIPQKGAG